MYLFRYIYVPNAKFWREIGVLNMREKNRPSVSPPSGQRRSLARAASPPPTMDPFLNDDVVQICHPSVTLEYDVKRDWWNDDAVLRVLFTSSSLYENRCMECGCDMGPHNPRQLCGKWECIDTYKPPIFGSEAAILVANRKMVAGDHARLVKMSFRPDRVSGMEQCPPTMLFLNRYQGLTAVDADLCMDVALVMYRRCTSCPKEIIELMCLYVSEEWFPTFKNYYSWSQDEYFVERGNVTILGNPRLRSIFTSFRNLHLPTGKWQHQSRISNQCTTTVAITPPPKPTLQTTHCPEYDDASDTFAMLHLSLQRYDKEGDLWVATRGSIYERRDALSSVPVALFLDTCYFRLLHYPPQYHWAVSRFYRRKKMGNKMVRVMLKVPVNLQRLVLSYLVPRQPWVVAFPNSGSCYWASAPASELVHYGRMYFLENYCDRTENPTPIH